MTDPFTRALTDRVAAVTPTTLPPFDEVRRRARRHRARNTLVVAASAAMVAGVVIGAWSLRGSDPGVSPDQPVGSPSGEASTRPDPTYQRSTYPSGLVARLPDRDVDLPADTSCWTGPKNCARALLMNGGAPDLGQQDEIDFWFARPGWTFSATFRRVGEDCPRATTVEAVATGDQWFQLSPADQVGQYVVDLAGNGPEGMVSTRFLWTTTSDGPVDPPQGYIQLAPESRGEGSYALEVMMNDLAFQPTRAELSDSVDVTVTAADDRQRSLTAPLVAPSLECGERGAQGSFYYQAEWDQDIAVLGRTPLDLGVTLTIRGTTYVGRATWDEATSRTTPYVPLTFTPPLPAANVD